MPLIESTSDGETRAESGILDPPLRSLLHVLVMNLLLDGLGGLVSQSLALEH